MSQITILYCSQCKRHVYITSKETLITRSTPRPLVIHSILTMCLGCSNPNIDIISDDSSTGTLNEVYNQTIRIAGADNNIFLVCLPKGQQGPIIYRNINTADSMDRDSIVVPILSISYIKSSLSSESSIQSIVGTSLSTAPRDFI